jgi:two-component system cell cycle sensor histidine kinase/response regulator CckA
VQTSRAPVAANPTALLQGLARLITWSSAQGSVTQVLTELAKFIEHLEPDMRASVHLIDCERGVLLHGAAPSLPDQYNASVDGIPYADGVGSCGTAAARRARVVVTDIATDPLWVNYKHLALPHGLRACWSAPFFDSQGAILGTFAMYYSTPRGPTEAESGLIDLAASVAGVVVERHRDAERLRDREARLRAIVDNEPECVMVLDLEGRVVQLNPAGLKMIDAQWHDIAEQPALPLVAAEHQPAVGALIGRALAGRTGILEFDVVGLQGTRRSLEAHVVPLTDAQGQVTSVMAVARDVTARRKAEAAVLELKKLESIGRLAGGVAHDFNNMLSAILGFTELALYETPADSVVRERLLEIQKAANRSAELTRQLLAFARRETAQPRVVDFNAVVSGLLGMMHRLVGNEIELVWNPAAALWGVNLDPSQLDQILTSLLVNARDAIDGPGAITVATASVTLDEEFCERHPESRPGDFVALTVEDTGCGMTPEMMGRIFEPFFSTKADRVGTGLGLAAVYGSVRQNGGFILVDSAPGDGATFTVYMPRTDEPMPPAVGDIVDSSHPAHVVLLVEDEPAVLALTETVLRQHGYGVHGFPTPAAALAFLDEHSGPLDLLVTDVMMPGMTGRDLVREVHARRPDVPALYMSGYPADVIARQGLLDPGVEFLQKPFSVATLVGRAAEILRERVRQG